jgi:hypothetical protein
MTTSGRLATLLVCAAITVILGVECVLAQPPALPLPPQAPLPPPGPALPGLNTVSVHLQVDGNIAGTLSAADPAGALHGVRAKISLSQNGKVLASAHSDEKGHFQLVGVRPGFYTVTAVGPDGVIIIGVQVLPFEEAARESLFLDMTLVPVADADLLNTLLADQAVAMPTAPPMPTAGAYGGGGGGGGGAGMGWLGLGGLAGLAGLAGISGPASPAAP